MPEAASSSLLPCLRELAFLQGEGDEVAELLSDSTRVTVRWRERHSPPSQLQAVNTMCSKYLSGIIKISSRYV